MDWLKHNRDAWNAEVAKKNQWTVPVAPEMIERARSGQVEVVLTPTKPVPESWFPALAGLRVLGLAASGGQQAPILAAAGATVTVVDNSPSQLAQDRAVAEREGLDLDLREGDMSRLDGLEDQSFDLIFHPVSNCFVPDVLAVWRECFRVLRPGGILMAGIKNPIGYVFDYEASQRGELIARHRIPYSDLSSLDQAERDKFVRDGEPLIFGHSLEDQLGGQLEAGFVIDKMFEDYWDESSNEPLNKYIATFMATRAHRPA